ncbi:hypothetical protein LINPERHAP1_LOCUS27250 [Linum perenne]
MFSFCSILYFPLFFKIKFIFFSCEICGGRSERVQVPKTEKLSNYEYSNSERDQDSRCHRCPN